MLGQSTTNTDETSDESTFAGAPFKCRLSFYARGQNGTAPTLVNNKTNLHKGDLFVISLNEAGTQKLVLQVDEERPAPTGSAEIQIDESIKRTFAVPSFMRQEHRVQKVAVKEDFALYLVEMQVKEQYLSRGDMWRFTRKLIDTTVYLKKTLDIFGMRATVYGLWVDGAPYRVSSGYITKDTKIVFRSLSACCTIFLQMSKEMWDFDHHGDTYYEKAVDGFLFDLFTRWKSMSCQHDVTMTLFSRVFYNAKALEDFPLSLRDDISQDHRGRFYEDFYCVIYQNERYDDWLPRLAKIKNVLVNYKEDLVDYHRKHLPEAEAKSMPVGTISNAADGNFLETLNLSASVFERHFIDRPFDRLGQMSVVITPGAGVFEVDRELTNMAKQRVLDNGIGSDLVCLGEQPLFAVPLFKFFKGDSNAADDYQIPHWMNLSYYHSSAAPSCFKRYNPRLPFELHRISNGILDVKTVMNSIADDTFVKPSCDFMEEYDKQVFRAPTKSSTKDQDQVRSIKKGSRPSRRRYITLGPSCVSNIKEDLSPEADEVSIVNSRVQSININTPHFNNNVKDDMALSTSNMQSTSLAGHLQFHSPFTHSPQIACSTPQRALHMAQSSESFFLSSKHYARLRPRPKPLTNPFAPASIRTPMVPSRRRWAHTFPIGPNRLPWHFHHLRQAEDAERREMCLSDASVAHLVLPGTSKHLHQGARSSPSQQQAKANGSARLKRLLSPSGSGAKGDTPGRKDSLVDDVRISFNGSLGKKANTDPPPKPKNRKYKQEAIIWGPTGVEPWSASMITGIDWKSLTIPASLPTTFDAAPSADELDRDYTHNSYTLIYALTPQEDDERKRKTVPGSTQDRSHSTDNLARQRMVFDELIDQRLSQGFQMIVQIPDYIAIKLLDAIRLAGYRSTEYNRLLCHGKVYHTLSLVTEENRSQDFVVTYVQHHKPRYIVKPNPVLYKYRFQCPDSPDYDAASYKLQIENLESFTWNLLDHVVGNHGCGDHKLADTTKYWHTRLVIMPVSRDYTIKSIESGQTKCDSHQEMSHEDYFLYVEHFVRFLVMLNKLSRLPVGSNESSHRPLDPITGKKRTDPPKRQPKSTFVLQTFKLADITLNTPHAVDKLVSLLRDDQQGLLFVKDSVLPEYTFIAIEAIWWAIEHGEDIDSEPGGLLLFQTLFARGLIRHCTNIETSFRFGFFLYYIVTEKSKDFCLKSNDYAEVEFHETQSFIPSMDYLGFGESTPMRLLPKLIAGPQPPVVRTARFNSSGVTFPPIGVNPNPNQRTSCVVLKRDCNVDVDPMHVSDRREWATAHYHSYYNPHCLFELEIRWLVATSCILGDLITQWSHRTGTMVGPKQVAFHLIPIPCDPFAEFDALRGAIYIHMNSACLHEKLADLPENDRTRRLNIFQELILKRYGFILNSCVSYSNEKIYHVHISGGMLVYIISDVFNVHYNRQSTRVTSSESAADEHASPMACGFYWCWNFCLGKKWRSSQTGGEKYQDIMLADFRAFCANDDNRLVNFWVEADRMAREKLAEKQGPILTGDSASIEVSSSI